MSLLLRSVYLLSFVFLLSCNSNTASSGEKGNEAKGKEYTSEYICPMHCEGSGSSEPGTCPVCGMDYVKNPDL